jgi:Fe-S-cluster containining protein
MPDAWEEYIDGPAFECGCCGQCCRRDPYYAVSLLDIRNISMSLDMSPGEFFDRYCEVIDTPGGFRYPAILAPDGCPFLRGAMCGIHFIKPIGCRVFPESALIPVTLLKKSITAIPSCAILAMPDDDRPLKADPELLAARDLHFKHTRQYFAWHDSFDEPSWREATGWLIAELQDPEGLERRSAEIRARATGFRKKPRA